MFAMFNNAFAALTSFFIAFSRFGKALENLSNVTVEMSQEYSEISRLERHQRIQTKLKELGINEMPAAAETK